MLQVERLPFQQNYHDCGLFTLVYTEFFTAFPPRQVHFLHSHATTHTRSDALTKVAEKLAMPNGLLMQWPQDTGPYPNFLSQEWFTSANPYNLRFQLTAWLLEEMTRTAIDEGKGEQGYGEQVQRAYELADDARKEITVGCAPCM